MTDRRQPARRSNQFRLEGDYWTIAYAGLVVHLRASRGLAYLARLLAHPGTGIAAAEIATADHDAAGTTDERARERARVTVTKSIGGALRRIECVHPELGRHLGATIRRGYVCVYAPDPRVPIRWQL